MAESTHFISKHDRLSLHEVRGKYLSLRDMIQGLSSKLTSVSTHIEEEFLSAYRVHMLSMQQELRDLKLQVVKAEDALNEDKQVATLEHEVTWFSDETMRLKNQAASMKKDMQHVVTRTQALREQRLFLDEQLKSTLKRSRILEAEIAEATREQQQDSLQEGSGAQHFKMQGSASAPVLTRPARQQKKFASTRSKPRFPALQKSPQKSSAGPTDTLLFPKKVEVESKQLPLGRELEQVKMSRQPAEIDLETALRSVLREITERKVAATARDMRCSVEEARTMPKFFEMGGLTGLGLEHFSDSDRLSAISMFLATPASFRGVVRLLKERRE